MIVISGTLWALVGIMLMTLGIHHLTDGMRAWDIMAVNTSEPLFQFLTKFFSKTEQAMTAIIGICLMLGYLKGHFALGRSVKSGVQRILTYPNPSEIKNLYGKKYYALIALMMGLGIALRILNLPQDVHGAIDLVIGSALLKGALSYYKYALAEKKGMLIHEKW